MTTKPLDRLEDFTIEPERYELTGEPSYRFDLTRRDFFARSIDRKYSRSGPRCC